MSSSRKVFVERPKERSYLRRATVEQLSKKMKQTLNPKFDPKEVIAEWESEGGRVRRDDA